MNRWPGVRDLRPFAQPDAVMFARSWCRCAVRRKIEPMPPSLAGVGAIVLTPFSAAADIITSPLKLLLLLMIAGS